MNGDMAVRSITASISLWIASSAPRTISSVTGSHTRAAPCALSCGICLNRPCASSSARDTGETLPQNAGTDEGKLCGAPCGGGALGGGAGRCVRGLDMSEDCVVAAVSAANVKAHVEHITTNIPSRLAGSANAKRMAEYSAAALTKAGVAAQVFEMPGLVSFPDKAEMRVLAPVELVIEAN